MHRCRNCRHCRHCCHGTVHFGKLMRSGDGCWIAWVSDGYHRNADENARRRRHTILLCRAALMTRIPSSSGSDVDRAHITARYDDIDSVGRSSDLPLLLSGPIPALVRAFVGAFGRTHGPVPCSVSPSAIYGDVPGVFHPRLIWLRITLVYQSNGKSDWDGYGRSLDLSEQVFCSQTCAEIMETMGAVPH